MLFFFFQVAKKELVVYAFQPSENLNFFFLHLFFGLFHFVIFYFTISSNKFTFHYFMMSFVSIFLIVIHNIKCLIKGIGRFIK
jgi:hypothetical protein